jgi:sugar phosphate isomerase/epimerase
MRFRSADSDTLEDTSMPVELLATCWTHAGNAVPVRGRNLSPIDLRTRAEAVAGAGFTGIGFTIDDLDAAAGTYRLPEVKAICTDLGLVHIEVELLENWWTTGDVRRVSDRTRMSLLAAAEALEARQVKIGPDCERIDGAVAPLVDVEHWAAELHRLAGQAADVGTRVALEPLPFSNITDFRLAAELVAAADHPAAGLVVDIWHLEFGPSTLADLAAVPGDKVFVVELNDAPALQSTDLFHETIHRRVLFGDGVFDVAGFITTLQHIGFRGPWGVEIISDAHRARPLPEALIDTHRRTMAVFDKLAGHTPGI